MNWIWSVVYSLQIPGTRVATGKIAAQPGSNLLASLVIGCATWLNSSQCNTSGSYVDHFWVKAFKSKYTLHQRRQWQPTPVPLPGKSHGQRSLVGCSPWGSEESDTTERLHFHFSFSCIGEENGNPLQCSCLENPRDEGAWWAVVYGVAQSRTRLKRLSSSSNSRDQHGTF